MSIQQNFPAISPSLSLNFARSKTIDPRITFTRTSSGTRTNETGLIEVVPANSPRFDHSYDPVSGTVRSLGLLVEEQRTNLIPITTNNENGLPITDFNYPMSGFDENNTELDIAPDGNLVLCKYNLTGANSPFLNINSTASITAGVTYTMSMWVKGGSSYSASFAWVNQTTNEVPNTTISITPEWRRYTFSFTPQFNSTSSRLQIFFSTQGNDKIISVWGAQLEPGSFATSYIPRPSGQATRTADNVSMVGENFSSWYNQDEGTIYVSQKLKSIDTVDRNSLVYLINGGSGNDIFYNVKGGDTNIFVFGDDGTNYSRWQENGDSTDTKAIWAYDVSGDDFKPYWNGIEGINESTHTPSATSHTQLEIGATAGAKYNGHISQLTYYPRRLTNSNLQNLTK
jgi:hypothetical protein